MIKGAILDKTRKYRYVLWRKWGDNDKNFVNFILLNPSIADENTDDRTVTACIKIAKNLECDGIYITNLFAFRATKPHDMKNAIEPIGEKNNKYLRDISTKSKITILAWGNHGDFLNRDIEVIKLLTEIQVPHCLEVTKRGKPKHPLYIKRTVKPFHFNYTFDELHLP